MTLETILQLLTTWRAEARTTYRAELKGVCGSYARGAEKETSDVDILVDFQPDADLFDFIGLGQFLEDKLPCAVDIVPERDIRPELRDSILREAIYL